MDVVPALERTLHDRRFRLALGIAVSIAALAAATSAGFDSGRAPSSNARPLLDRHGELAWPSVPRRSGGAAAAVSPARLLAPSASSTLSVLGSFAGASSAETTGDPPDPVIGAGSGFVVQMVNSLVRIWTADGQVRATYPAASFFQTATEDVSDPQVVFDRASRRWFATIVDVTRASVQVAVSLSSDPTGPWTVYSHSAGSCPDQPSLGVGAGLVVVGYGAYSTPCRSDPQSYLGGALFTYDKQQLLDGPAPQALDWGPRPDISPVATAGGRAVALVAPGRAGGPTYLELIGPGPKAAVTRLPIRTLSPPPPAVQPGTSLTVDTNDVRILSTVTRGRTLWLAGNEGCVPPRDRLLRSCLRVVAVSGNRVVMDADIGSARRDFFYPALALDGHGDVAVAHGFSSAGEYPGLSALLITPRNRTTRETTIARGTGPVLSDRFGDYFGAATDEGGRVWTTGETGLASVGWATTVASLATRPGR